VLVGSLVSSSAPDRYIRPVITFVIAASGLKYVGLGTTALGWVLCGILLAAAAIWLAYLRPRRAVDVREAVPSPELEDLAPLRVEKRTVEHATLD
jgi:hypothetical protein